MLCGVLRRGDEPDLPTQRSVLVRAPNDESDCGSLEEKRFSATVADGFYTLMQTYEKAGDFNVALQVQKARRPDRVCAVSCCYRSERIRRSIARCSLDACCHGVRMRRLCAATLALLALLQGEANGPFAFCLVW